MSSLGLSRWKDADVPIIISVNVATTLALLLVARLSFHGPKQGKTYRSPRETLLPKLTKQQTNDLPYPPDSLPGGRYVDTPYGTIRVYEFGPETGRKVLFVHGISTPLGGVAHGLADKGCRVMLFGMYLWGRGYSDAPADLAHDERLYASQIMFVLASSELAWKKFDLIGYSLGGGISANFASYFPHLIESLILLAPAGLVRPERIGGIGKFLYSSGIFPEAFLQWFVKRRLLSGPISPKAKALEKGNKTNVEDAVNAETEASSQSQNQASISRTHPNVSLLGAVQWQIHANVGFVNSFVSSVQFAPISRREATWKRLGLLLSEKTISKPKLFQTGKILVIAGRNDLVIVPNELQQDIHNLIGDEYYQWEMVEGAHDFPTTKSVETVRIVAEYLGLEG